MAAERIIFLDIDGVLNCKRTPNPRKLPYIVDPALLKRFTRVVERTGADVVLSSTWRYDPAGLFSAKHWGVPFIDVIPDMPQQPRRDEIMAWLKGHGEVSDELPLFQPAATTGLSEKIADGLSAYLLGRTDKNMRCNRLQRFLQNIHSIIREHIG
jgi:hypothetical protein